MDAVLGRHVERLLTLTRRVAPGRKDPILKFFVVGITFYGMSTFEGPLLSVKVVNSLSHYTDWNIAHVTVVRWDGSASWSSGWLLADARLYQTGGMAKQKWVEWHFWLGTIGICCTS